MTRTEVFRPMAGVPAPHATAPAIPWKSTFLLAMALAICIAASFRLHAGYLHLGFREDDYDFLRRYGVFSWHSVINAFNPFAIQWYYRPLLVLWFLLFSVVAPHNPVAMHGASLVLDGANAFLLGAFVYRIIKEFATDASMSMRLLMSTLAAALLLTSQSVDEAVYWISSASTLLATMLSLTALHLWMCACQTERTAWRVAGMAAMAAAMCAKEDAVLLPVMLCVIDWTYCRRAGRRVSRLRLWMLLAVWTVVYGVLDIAAYQLYSATTTSGALWHGTHAVQLTVVSSFVYRTLFVYVDGDPFSPITNSTLALLTILAVLVWSARHSSLLLTAIALAVLAALPLPIACGEHVASNRFNYYPSVFGILLMTAMITAAFRSTMPTARLAGIAAIVNFAWTKCPIPSIDLVSQWAIILTVAIAGIIMWRSAPAEAQVTKSWALFVSIFALVNLGYEVLQIDDKVGLALIAVTGGVFGAITCRVAKQSAQSVLGGTAASLVLHMAMPISAIAFLLAPFIDPKRTTV